MKTSKDDIIDELAAALKYLLAQLDDPTTNGLDTIQAIANAYDVLEAHGLETVRCPSDPLEETIDDLPEVKY